jgi:hypothetical protein
MRTREPTADGRRESRGGVFEDFELAEEDLIEHASHGDRHTPARIMRDAWPDEDAESASIYGEADNEYLSD